MKGGGLAGGGSIGVKKIPDDGIFYEEPFAFGADADSLVAVEVAFLAGLGEHAGAFIAVHGFGCQSGWHSDQLFRGGFPELEGKLIGIIETWVIG